MLTLHPIYAYKADSILTPATPGNLECSGKLFRVLTLVKLYAAGTLSSAGESELLEPSTISSAD